VIFWEVVHILKDHSKCRVSFRAELVTKMLARVTPVGNFLLLQAERIWLFLGITDPGKPMWETQGCGPGLEALATAFEFLVF